MLGKAHNARKICISTGKYYIRKVLMKKITLLSLASLTALLLAVAPSVHAQDFLFQPDSIGFGDVAVGLTGDTLGNRTLAITNNTDADQEIRVGFTNISHPEDIELIEPEIASIRKVLRDIFDAVGCYHQDYGEDPNEGFDLIRLGYLRIDEEVLWNWHFALIGSPVTQIEAVSDGIVVLFDTQTGRITYNVQGNGSDGIDQYSLYRGESRTFVLAFGPHSQGAVAGWMNLTWGEHQSHLPISGNGFVKQAISLSSQSLDFGGINLERQAALGLGVTNTAEELIYLEYERRADSRFYLYIPAVAGVRDYILEIYSAVLRYRERFNEDPQTVELLWETGWLQLNDEITNKWQFTLIGSPVTQIEAVSTPNFQYGGGRDIMYDIQEGTFNGFGMPSGEGTFQILQAKDRTVTYYIGYAPLDVGDVQDSIRLLTYAGDPQNSYQEYYIRLRGSGLSVSNSGTQTLPLSFSLSKAYPNPFNSSTFVTYSTPYTGNIRASLMDISGREWTRWTEEMARPGEGRIRINAGTLGSGLYWLRLEQNGREAVTRLVLVR